MPEICVMITFVTIPDIEIVGVAAMASENAAVTVTVAVTSTRLSGSVSVKVTVGATESIIKVILSVPE